MTKKKHTPAVKAPGSTLEWLRGRVEAYLAQNPHITLACFGRASVGDTGLVERLRNGGDVTTRKLDALIKYMGTPKQKETKDGKETSNGKETSADRS